MEKQKGGNHWRIETHTVSKQSTKAPETVERKDVKPTFLIMPVISTVVAAAFHATSRVDQMEERQSGVFASACFGVQVCECAHVQVWL